MRKTKLVLLLVMLLYTQLAAYGQVFNNTQITDYANGNDAYVTSGNALRVDVASSSGTANVNVSQINGSSAATGNGLAGVGGVQRVTIASDSTGQVQLAAGSNLIGSVSQSGTWNIGTITNAVTVNTHAVTQSGTWNVGLNAGSNVIGAVTQSGTWNIGSITTVPTHAVTQSGTWNVGISAGSNLIGGIKLIDTAGVNAASVSAGGALKVDGSAVTQPVSGTFWQATQPVSGTVTANIGSSGSLALDATLTGGTQKAVARGGAKGATTAADITSTSIDADHNALDVYIRSSGGGGGTTQYAEDAAAVSGDSGVLCLGVRNDANAVLTNTDGDYSGLAVDSAGRLKVASIAGTSTVSGTVNANQSGTWSVTTTPFSTGLLMQNATANGAGFPISGYSVVNIDLDSTTTGATWNFESSTDGGVTYIPVMAEIATGGVVSYATTFTASATRSVARINAAGMAIQARISGYTSGTHRAIGTTTAAGSVTASLPTHGVTQSGTWNIGTLTSITNPVAVTGTFWQATQPVSGTVAATQSGTWTVQPGNTANTTPWLASINAGGNTATVTASNALKVDGSAVTQPVSGTFWQATQPVSGTFWQATQPVSGTVAATQSGTWTVQPGNTANTTPWLVTHSIGGSAVSATNGLYANLLQGNAVLSPTNGLPTVAAAQTKATYTACSPSYTTPATPTDMVTIYGSGTKTVKILRVRVWKSATTATVKPFYLIRKSATNTGASNAVTVTKHDSNNASATASVAYYTTNPSALGAEAGRFLDGVLMDLPDANLAVRPLWQEVFLADELQQPIVLRGTSEGLAFNFGGAVLPTGMKVFVEFTWTEE